MCSSISEWVAKFVSTSLTIVSHVPIFTEKFLLSPEAPGRRQEDQQPSIAAALRGSDYGWIDRARASPISAQPSEKTALLKDSEASETSNVILHEPKLEIQSGLLVAVVGPVGCGKSSLLLALLGEMPSLSTGERTDFLNGVVSYAGQVRNVSYLHLHL